MSYDINVIKQHKPAVLSIGNFDGVHLGHQYLLKKTLELAKKNNTTGLVVSFFPHPAQVLYPQKTLLRLFDLQDQEEQIKKQGIDRIHRLQFNIEMSKMSPEVFFKDQLLTPLNPRGIVVGNDFHFGNKRLGDVKLLSQLCERSDIEFLAVEPFKFEEKIVSSSVIRDFLVKADLINANKFLGREYSIRGRVIKGYQKGSQIGFPTANLELSKEMNQQLLLKPGVYATEVLWKQNLYKSIMNIGVNPTVSVDTKLKIEIHIFNFNQDIYGQELLVFPKQHIRSEIKFNSIEELKIQINKDICVAKEILK